MNVSSTVNGKRTHAFQTSAPIAAVSRTSANERRPAQRTPFAQVSELTVTGRRSAAARTRRKIETFIGRPLRQDTRRRLEVNTSWTPPEPDRGGRAALSRCDLLGLWNACPEVVRADLILASD